MRDTIRLTTQTDGAPSVHTRRIDTLWFQVGGTICNLKCSHCFLSCSPENGSFGLLSLETCERFLTAAAALGVQGFYFTGGEPFANPELCDILERALRDGPATVLTNATLFRARTLDRLEMMRHEALHPLEIRVSIDGYSAEMNDGIRGEGTFAQTIEGTRKLLERGFEPIVTITRTWTECDDAVLALFRRLLVGIGYQAPRLKILPSIKLGAEVTRTGPYHPNDGITVAMMDGFDESRLLCSSARLVTDRGVWVCPILPDFPEARVGRNLAESIVDYPLRHAACRTCWHHGAICSNTTCADSSTPCTDSDTTPDESRTTCGDSGSKSNHTKSGGLIPNR